MATAIEDARAGDRMTDEILADSDMKDAIGRVPILPG
jgi:hypothetical protein